MKIKTKFIIELDLDELIGIKENTRDILNDVIDAEMDLSDLEEFDDKIYFEMEYIRDKLNGYLM